MKNKVIIGFTIAAVTFISNCPADEFELLRLTAAFATSIQNINYLVPGTNGSVGGTLIGVVPKIV